MASERYLAIKVVMMPRDTNPHGTIFGGVLMSYIDQAGAVGARHEIMKLGVPLPPIVTVAIDKVEFHEPVYVGDTVCCYADLVKVGRTSMQYHMEVWTLSLHHQGRKKVAEGIFTFVAIDRNGKPQPVDR